VDVPQSIRVTGDGIEVSWADGPIRSIAAADLRAACPCAECRDGRPRIADTTRHISVSAARLVGNYAVAFTFDPDSHESGIYPFDLLARLGVSAGRGKP
jgi:DUF971 family protein